jgi:hypothetical protein
MRASGHRIFPLSFDSLRPLCLSTAAALIAYAALIMGCGSKSPTQTAAVPATPSTPSAPISTATNPAVVAKTLYIATGGTVPGTYEYAANADGNVDPTAIIGASLMGDAVDPDAATTDASGNLYELVAEAGFVLGLSTGCMA